MAFNPVPRTHAVMVAATCWAQLVDFDGGGTVLHTTPELPLWQSVMWWLLCVQCCKIPHQCYPRWCFIVLQATESWPLIGLST